MMDQAVSIVLIYCFILSTEIIVGMVLVTSILSSIEDYDDIDNVIYYVDNIDRYILYKIFQESIFEVLNPSKISEKKLKNSAESVSVSTQTDDTMIYDTIIMNTCPTEDDNNTIIECPSCPANPIIQCTMPESETEEIPHEDEKINMLDTEISPDDNDSGKKFSQLMNNTWRDCQFSTIETFWTHLFVRT